MLSFFSNIYYLLGNGRKIQDLALRVEGYARELNGLPAERPASDVSDVASILESSCMLLERFVENQNPVEEETKEDERKSETKDESVKFFKEISENDLDTATDKSEEKDETEIEEIVVPQPPILSINDEPSVTAKEIIKLCDWLFVAKSRDTAPTMKTLEIVYSKLGNTLSKEGIKPLEETGTFDENKHSAVEKKDTDDPSKNNLISDTVRPGYLFNNEVFRPQEVVVYVYQKN